MAIGKKTIIQKMSQPQLNHCFLGVSISYPVDKGLIFIFYPPFKAMIINLQSPRINLWASPILPEKRRMAGKIFSPNILARPINLIGMIYFSWKLYS